MCAESGRDEKELLLSQGSYFDEVGSRAARAVLRRCTSAIANQPKSWEALDAELDRWAPMKAVFWWRDDDAVASTPALHRLLSLQNDLDLPLHIAAIPALASPCLAQKIDGCAGRRVRILAHGWKHDNRAAVAEVTSEFPASRSPADVRRELRMGQRLLADMFGPRLAPVFVPPWNRFACRLVGLLDEAGFTHLSMDGDFHVAKIPTCNVHADVIDWRTTKAAHLDTLLATIVTALRLRRWQVIPKSAPIGVVTHHRAHDESIWKLTFTLLCRLKTHSSVAFAEASELFAQ